MPSETRRERKVVTVVFCDLVGFTNRAEKLDPEDVEALLGPYHERLRAELERHGGTVEKFIGDAVMALFGAPTAHEDDPERAVRACLAIRDWAIEEDDVQVRIAVTTGEALIRLDARPEAGEGMASGDVVNTAARLQGAAPVNGILVDETSYRATRQAIDYDEAAAVDAKGKAEPISVWEAAEARSRFGVDVTHHARAELVGRERELSVLRDAFERARHERLPQLITLVAVPGMGKSRLVYELSRIVDSDPEIITWRQGRCLAYGDGITLWALGEIVKAQAGVLEQDTPAETAEKVHQVVEDTLAGTGDEARVESHLLALLGLAEETQLGGDRRNEAFAAWRRFLEGLAEHRPLVLIVEDIHWADESLLDFLNELVEWVTDVPLLVVATARPELLERRPDWGGGKLNATTLALSPLSDEQTAELIGRLLAKPVLAAESQQALLERAGGNPLYAEQFVELYLEQGSTDDLPLPETLQGIIAARLDGLPGAEKSLLQDAAVVGKVFWTGGFEQDADDVTSTLHSLERKGFVRRQRRSSLEGSGEFAFAHALVRDVAYGQIARAGRVAKHRRTAEWIAGLGRPEDHAEMLAYHWSSALELVRASGGDDDELAARTRLALRDAGDRAYALNSFPVAAAHYEDALALWPDDEERRQLLFSRAQALFIAGDEKAPEALENARDVLVQFGDRERAAEAEAFLAQMFWFQGRLDAVFPHLHAAESLVEGAEPSPGVARVLAWSARYEMLARDSGGGLRHAEEALEMADRLGLDDLRVHALTTIGSAKEFLGDTTGREDLERAVEIGRTASSPMTAGALNNLGVVIDTTDARRVQTLYREGIREAERFGDTRLLRFLRANIIPTAWILGEWDDALNAANDFIAECEEGSPHILEGPTRQVRGYIELARGHRDEALEDMGRSLALAREQVTDTESLVQALTRNAWALLQLGRIPEARAAFAEALPFFREHPYARPWTVSEVALELGMTSTAREILAGLPPSPGNSAMVAVLDRNFEEASELYASAGILLFEAEARLRAAEQLLAAGRKDDADAELEKSLSFYRSVGATLFIERGEELLATAQSESA